jgi:glycosyltransferase involved in cell wall biosynthesis
MNKLISIIVPIYNVEKYLRDCLDSIVNQTYKNLEIILVDDGSTDDSYSIAKEYKDKDSRVILVRKENGGISRARNLAISLSKGEFIGFVDSDDIISIYMFEKMLENIGDNDFICCDVNVFRNNLSQINIEHDKYFDIPFIGQNIISPESILKIPTVVWNKLYRADIIKKQNISFPVGLLYEDDYFFWCYVTNNPKVFCLPEVLYFYRKRNDSIMGQISLGNQHRVIEIVNIMNLVFEILIKNTDIIVWKQSFLECLEKHFDYKLKRLDSLNRYKFHLSARGLVKNFSLIEVANFNILYHIATHKKMPIIRFFGKIVFETLVFSHYTRYKVFGITIFKHKTKKGIKKWS